MKLRVEAHDGRGGQGRQGRAKAGARAEWAADIRLLCRKMGQNEVTNGQGGGRATQNRGLCLQSHSRDIHKIWKSVDGNPAVPRAPRNPPRFKEKFGSACGAAWINELWMNHGTVYPPPPWREVKRFLAVKTMKTLLTQGVTYASLWAVAWRTTRYSVGQRLDRYTHPSPVRAGTLLSHCEGGVFLWLVKGGFRRA